MPSASTMRTSSGPLRALAMALRLPSNRVSMSAACSESELLLNAYGTAVQELFMFQEQHFAALVDGDEDATRYELLIHMAGEKRQAAKYAYLRHVEEHGCEKAAQEAVAEFA